MRHIPISAARVDTLRKQARKLQRECGGRQTDLLDQVAREAGYDHWHHVTVCAQTTQADQSIDAVCADRERVVCATQDGIVTRAILGHLKDVYTAPFFDSPFDTSLTYHDTVDLTPELIGCLVSEGWARTKIEHSMRDGARYSLSRGSLVHALPGMFD